MSVNLRDYEAVLIASPELNEEAVSTLRTQLNEVVSRHQGKLLESVVLGKRKLSYPLGRWSEGLYLQLRLQLPPSEVAALEKAVKMMEGNVRFMVTHPSSPAPVPAAPTVAVSQPGKE